MIEERERLASALRAIGLRAARLARELPLRPRTRTGASSATRLLHQGLVVRAYDDGIRITIRDRVDDDLLVEALARRARPAGAGRGAPAGRRVRHLRATAETRIAVRLGLDGACARVASQTGAGIYDHFLEQLAFHAGLDLVVEGAGDLETGDHHTVEDTALAFGEALDRALGDRRGIARYGDATVPMDDALARAAVDLGGRPFAELSIEPEPGMAAHFFGSLAQAGRLAIHVEATGRDAHHVAEAAYKAVGRALKTALRSVVGVRRRGIPSRRRAVGLLKVAVCDYRAGNIRSVEIALRRLGAELVDDVAGRRPRRAAGRRLGPLGDGRAPARRARRGAAGPDRRGPRGARDLPRPPARARALRGGRRRRGARASSRAGRCG